MRYKQFFFTFLIAAISCGFAGEIDFSRYPKRKCCFPEAETLFAVPGRMIFRIFHRGLLTSAWKFVIINIEPISKVLAFSC